MAAANRIKLPGMTAAVDLHDARIAQIETTVNNNENPVTAKAVKAVTDRKADRGSSGNVSGDRVDLNGTYVYADGVVDTDHDVVFGLHGTSAATLDGLPDSQKLVTKKYVDDAIAAALAQLQGNQ